MRDVWAAFVGPFAYLGLVGAWLTLVALGVARPMEAVTVVLLVVTPITAGLLGAALSLPRARARWKVLAVCFPVLVVAAGMANGLGVALIMTAMEKGHARDALQVGLLFGGFCGAAFIPAMLWTFLAAVRVGRARPGSVLDAALRRAPWAAVAASSAIAVCAVGQAQHAVAFSFMSAASVAAWMLGLGVVTLLGVLGADVRALVRATRRARIAVIPTVLQSSHPGDVLDLGVGEELHAEKLEGPETAYRDGGLRVTRLRGTVAVVKRTLAGIVAVDAVAMAVALACVGRLLMAASAADATMSIVAPF